MFSNFPRKNKPDAVSPGAFPCSHEDQVRACYRAILDREPDREGLDHHLRMMAVEPSGENVIRSLLESNEYRRKQGPVLGTHRCFDFQLLFPENDWMLAEIPQTGVYEPYVIEAFREVCGDARVLDVGANIGVFSCAAALLTCEIVTAVEAAPGNVRLLKINACLNKLRNIEILPIAAAAETGPVTISSRSSDGIIRDDMDGASYGDFDIVWGTPLDAVVKDRVDVFKIDIEGREYAALQGAQQILDGMPIMFIEFSPNFMMEGCGVAPEIFLAMFFERGYEVTILHRDMTREPVRQNLGRLIDAWGAYMERSVTHLDLMLTPAA